MQLEEIDFQPDQYYFVRISPNCPAKRYSLPGHNLLAVKSQDWGQVDGKIAAICAGIAENGRTYFECRQMGIRNPKPMFDVAATKEDVAEIEERYRADRAAVQPGTVDRPNLFMPRGARRSAKIDDAIATIAERARVENMAPTTRPAPARVVPPTRVIAGPTGPQPAPVEDPAATGIAEMARSASTRVSPPRVAAPEDADGSSFGLDPAEPEAPPTDAPTESVERRRSRSRSRSA